MRKIIYVLLITTILSMMASTSVVTAETKENYDEEIGVLTFLKVIQNDNNEEFKPDEMITRAELVVMVMRLMNYEESAQAMNGNSRFTDVSIKTLEGKYINLAADMGVINGLGYGRFGADEYVQYQEAVKIILTCLGYSNYADLKGGYPLGYMFIANEKKMTAGISKGGSDTLECKEAAKLLFNSLYLSFMECIKIGDSYSFEEKKNETVIGKCQKMNILKGKVTANEFTSLNGQSNLAKHSITIDNVVYTVEDADWYKYIGRNVVYFTDMMEDENNILYMYPAKGKNAETIIASSSIESINDKLNIKYFDNAENGRLLSAKIEYNASVLKNGIFYGKAGTSMVTDEDLQPDSGGLILLDADSDGKYEVVFINDYQTYVVDRVDSSSKIIYDKYSNSPLILDDEEDVEISYNITYKGQKIQLEDLKEWDILSVANADCIDGTKRLVNIVAENKKVIGNIDEKSTGENGKGLLEIVLDGISYTVANNYYKDESYKTNTRKLDMNSKITAYLNIDGQIAAISTINRAGDRFGYLVSFERENGIDNTYEFEIFSSSGTMEYLQGAGNLMINGCKDSNLDNVLQAKNAAGDLIADDDGNKVYSQLIKYTVNDNGDINKIITAKSGYDINEFSLSYMSSSAQVFNESGLIDGTYKWLNSTIVFFIPQDATNDDEYRIMKPVFNSNIKYNMSIYEVDNLYNAGVIVVKDIGTEAKNLITISSLDKPIILVNKITKVLDNLGLTAYRLYGLYNGKEVEYNIKESLGDASLHQGDIIRCNFNELNEIKDVFLEYCADTDIYYNTDNVSGFRERYTGTVTSPEVLWCYGKVVSVTGATQMFVNGSNYNRRFDFGTYTKIYKFDRQRKKVELSSFIDIKVGDVVYAHSHRGRTFEIVIYR